MVKIYLAVASVLMIIGCSSKEEQALMKNYQNHKTYYKKLQKTEKTQLSLNGTTKILLTATYLNNTYLNKSIFSEDKNATEDFIIGVYNEDNEVQSLVHNGFSLTLGGKDALNMKSIKEGSPLLKEIAFVSEWSKFYLVHFPHTTKKEFDLVINSEIYGKGTLHFAKFAKYVFEKHKSIF